jgi:hypothetical protein
MRTGTLARVVAIVLAIIGVACLVASLVVATKQITVSVQRQKFDCGSVLSSKDPRDLAGSRGRVTPLYKQANNQCQKRNDENTKRAIRLFVVGVIPLLIVLMVPALARRSRMARAHRRTRL